MNEIAARQPEAGHTAPKARPSTRTTGFWSLRAASDELLGVDLMRFVASVGIVLCHSSEYLVARNAREYSHAQTAGLALFVDLFFIISGFVIAYVYDGRIGSLKDYGRFLQRRVGRLVPLHWATLALGTVIILGIGASGLSMNNPPDTSARCLAKAALLLHAIVPCPSPPPNGVSWSISAEMAMYILFPVFAYLMHRARAFAPVVPLAALVICGTLAGGFSSWGTQLGVLRAFPAFLFGMMLLRYRPALARIPAAWTLALLCAAGVIAGSYMLWHEAVILALAYGGATFAIAADTGGRTPAYVRRFAPLGQLTYSLYMLHGLVILTMVSGFADKILKLPQPLMVVACWLAYGFILFAAHVSFKLFETPARRWIDSLGARKTA